MDNKDLNKANNILDLMNDTRMAKHIKKENGLIERIEKINKVVLTEDNKMLLND